MCCTIQGGRKRRLGGGRGLLFGLGRLVAAESRFISEKSWEIRIVRADSFGMACFQPCPVRVRDHIALPVF